LIKFEIASTAKLSFMNVGLSLRCSCPRHSALLSKVEGVEQYVFHSSFAWLWMDMVDMAGNSHIENPA